MKKGISGSGKPVFNWPHLKKERENREVVPLIINLAKKLIYLLNLHHNYNKSQHKNNSKKIDIKPDPLFHNHNNSNKKDQVL